MYRVPAKSQEIKNKLLKSVRAVLNNINLRKRFSTNFERARKFLDILLGTL